MLEPQSPFLGKAAPHTKTIRKISPSPPTHLHQATYGIYFSFPSTSPTKVTRGEMHPDNIKALLRGTENVWGIRKTTTTYLLNSSEKETLRIIAL